MLGAIASHYVASAAVSYDAEVLADAPEVYLKLDETTGDWLDASGNGRNFTPGAGVTRNLTGLVNDGGKAASGSGSDAIGTRAAALPTSLTGATQTLEAWINMPSTTVKGGIVKIGANGNGWTMGLGTTRADTLGRNLVIGRNGLNWHGTDYAISDGRHHLVIARNGTAFTSYVDGVQVNTQSPGNPNAPGAELRVGNEESGATFLSSTVVVDNVAFYGVALSASRIAAHYAAG